MYTAECAGQGSQDHSQSQMDRIIFATAKDETYVSVGKLMALGQVWAVYSVTVCIL